MRADPFDMSEASEVQLRSAARPPDAQLLLDYLLRIGASIVVEGERLEPRGPAVDRWSPDDWERFRELEPELRGLLLTPGELSRGSLPDDGPSDGLVEEPVARFVDPPTSGRFWVLMSGGTPTEIGSIKRIPPAATWWCAEGAGQWHELDPALPRYVKPRRKQRRKILPIHQGQAGRRDQRAG